MPFRAGTDGPSISHENSAAAVHGAWTRIVVTEGSSAVQADRLLMQTVGQSADRGGDQRSAFLSGL